MLVSLRNVFLSLSFRLLPVTLLSCCACRVGVSSSLVTPPYPLYDSYLCVQAKDIALPLLDLTCDHVHPPSLVVPLPFLQAKDPQADVLPTVQRTFKFAEFRSVLNEVNDVFDEDTQRGTDLIIR